MSAGRIVDRELGSDLGRIDHDLGNRSFATSFSVGFKCTLPSGTLQPRDVFKVNSALLAKAPTSLRICESFSIETRKGFPGPLSFGGTDVDGLANADSPGRRMNGRRLESLTVRVIRR